jgi:hypothetical protein
MMFERQSRSQRSRTRNGEDQEAQGDIAEVANE